MTYFEVNVTFCQINKAVNNNIQENQFATFFLDVWIEKGNLWLILQYVESKQTLDCTPTGKLLLLSDTRQTLSKAELGEVIKFVTTIKNTQRISKVTILLLNSGYPLLYKNITQYKTSISKMKNKRS